MRKLSNHLYTNKLGSVGLKLVEVVRLRLERFQMIRHPLLSYGKTNLEIIQLAVMPYVRCLLSPINVKDLLHEHGIDVSHETVWSW